MGFIFFRVQILTSRIYRGEEMTNKTIFERIERYTQTAAEGGACRACEGGAAPAALPAAAGHERVAAGEFCLLDIKDSISSQSRLTG